MKITPILFLDLDGTVRKNDKFVHGPEDVEIYDGVFDIIQSYKSRGWRVVAISNQGGIAMGFTDDHRVARAMQETNRLVGNLFDGMYWCKHHPDAKDEDDKYCFCRKPKGLLVANALMVLSRAHEENYRPDKCLFVGDSNDDRQCAANMGINFMDAVDWRRQGVI